ncbi:hypothetical protein Syun_001844 [Stephania yunnanensis]|uniref:RNase H type-1 domain-containing protein n=1 Tax=Stephania yunnanensis TaxID=152371 RepID=A0AAP0Q868_9MAGN
MAKLWGVYQGVLLCQAKRYATVEVELDSQCVLNIIQQRSNLNFTRFRLVRDIETSSIGTVHLPFPRHTKKWNTAANCLENLARDFPMGVRELSIVGFCGSNALNNSMST